MNSAVLCNSSAKGIADKVRVVINVNVIKIKDLKLLFSSDFSFLLLSWSKIRVEKNMAVVSPASPYVIPDEPVTLISVCIMM